MIKKRLSLSLLALVGSVLLFVVASFAWFAVLEIVNLNTTPVETTDINVTAVLYDSDNGVDFTVATNIDFQNQVPGDIKYYKVVVTNNNTFDVFTQLSLQGFTDSPTDLSADTSNYTAGKTLLDVIFLNASNNINSDTIEDQTLSSLLTPSSFVFTHENIIISGSGTAEFYFSFTVSEDVGNDYQNLQLEIDHLFVQSVQ